jgi:hypothetical protein
VAVAVIVPRKRVERRANERHGLGVEINPMLLRMMIRWGISGEVAVLLWAIGIVF